jgi:sugar lactone lactonase YvrE
MGAQIHMAQIKFRLGVVLRIIPLLLAGLALAAGSYLFGQTVVVPDEGNNRVLLYYGTMSDGQAASIVLGQSNFSSSTPGTSETAMNAPSAYAFDSDGNLYVSDTGNCRVMVFHPLFTDGEVAATVIGQPDANTACGSGASANSLGHAGGLAFDHAGNLWVADSGNSRVLRFKPPFKTGMAANLVLGQANLNSSVCIYYPSASSLCFPQGIAVDANNDVWVADSFHSRILEFKFPQKNGGKATLELGQPKATAFTSGGANTGGVSASSLYGPGLIAFDSESRLWVTDTGNSRVLRFDPTFRNGGAAALVLGQTTFTGNYTNQNGTPNAGTLYYPQGISIAGDGSVWVGDTGNNRTLQFLSPFSNGMAASLVLGQPDFISNQANQGNASPSGKTQNQPFYEAGASLIALAVLGGLAGGRQWIHRLRAMRQR